MAEGNSGGGSGGVAAVAIVVLVVLAVLAGGYMMFGRGGGMASSPAHAVTASISTPVGDVAGKASGH